MVEIDYTLVIYQGGYGTNLLTDDYIAVVDRKFRELVKKADDRFPHSISYKDLGLSDPNQENAFYFCICENKYAPHSGKSRCIYSGIITKSEIYKGVYPIDDEKI